MARRVMQKIEVQTSPVGVPQKFTWGGGLYTITHVDEHWKEAGRWWDGEPSRQVFRLRDQAGRVLEMHLLQKPVITFQDETREPQEGTWLLYSVED